MRTVVYTIETNDMVVHESGCGDQSRLAITATLTLEINRTGTLQFTLPPFNEALKANKITLLVPAVSVYRTVIDTSGTTTRKRIWKGRVIEAAEDIYKRVAFTCEGWLSVLRDTLVRPDDNYDNRMGDVINNPGYFFRDLITKHNQQMDLGRWTKHDATKKFSSVVVEGFPSATVPTNLIQERPVGNSTWYTTLDYIQSIFIDNETIGGFLWLDDHPVDDTIHYISDINARVERRINQKIELGKNLLDWSITRKASELATLIIPTGKNGRTLKDDTEIYDGKFTHVISEDWLQSEDTDKVYAETYGKIFRHIEYPEIDSRASLLQSATISLKEYMNALSTIELTAMDLSILGVDEDEIEITKYVNVVSEYNNVDDWYLCSSAELDLCNPANNRYHLGYDPTMITNRYNHLVNSVGSNNFLGFNNFDRFFNNKYRVISAALLLQDGWSGTLDMKLWKSYRDVHFDFSIYGINGITSTSPMLYIARLSAGSSEQTEWIVGPELPVGHYITEFYPEAVVNGTAYSLDTNNPMSFQVKVTLDGRVYIENKQTITYNTDGTTTTLLDLSGKSIQCSITWVARTYSTEAQYSRIEFTSGDDLGF